LRGLFLTKLVAALVAPILLLGPASSVKAESARALAVSASGFGDVSDKTRFTQQAISSALPGFEIVKTTDGTENTSWTAFVAEQEGLKILLGPGEGKSERERFRTRIVKNSAGSEGFFLEGGSGRVGYLNVSGAKGATAIMHLTNRLGRSKMASTSEPSNVYRPHRPDLQRRSRRLEAF